MSDHPCCSKCGEPWPDEFHAHVCMNNAVVKLEVR